MCWVLYVLSFHPSAGCPVNGSHQSRVNPADIDTCTCNALGVWNALGGWQVVTTRSARGGPKVTISSSNLYNTLFCFRNEKEKLFCWTSHTINPLFSVLVGWLFSGEEQVPPFPSVQRSTLPGGKAIAATMYLVWPKQPSSNSRCCPPTAHLFGHNLVIWGETWPKPQPRCGCLGPVQKERFLKERKKSDLMQYLWKSLPKGITQKAINGAESFHYSKHVYCIAFPWGK